ncbi:MAG TPA: hypothetical protein VKX17_12070 [Planctomycetota bacterium]|nr:hypothetical protein [Planctomycetota bacterium]
MRTRPNTFRCALAAFVLLSFAAFAADDNSDDENKPPPETKPPTDTTAPRPATFSDYVPIAPVYSPVTKALNQVVENSSSPVANQLVQTVTNESIFQPGAGPHPTVQPYSVPGAEGPPPLRSGPFLFHTGITVENFLNDNYFGSVTNPRASWLRNYSPNFSLSYQADGAPSIDMYYNATIHDYSTSVERDYYDESTGISIRIKRFGIDGLSFNIADAYNQTGNTIVNPLADQFDINSLEFRLGTRYATNSLPVGFRYAAGPLTLEATYSYDVTDYFSKANNASDAQQHTGTLRGSYDITPDHCTAFGECSYNYTRYPDNLAADYDFARLYAGVRGRFDSVTYQVKTGYSLVDHLATGTTLAHPLLAADVGYAYSPRFDFSLFANHSYEEGVLTGEQLTDAYGGTINIHPMLRGVLSISHIFQRTDRATTGLDRVAASELNYKHTILGWLEPHLGTKYSLESVSGGTRDNVFTGLGGIGFVLKPNAVASVDYYHEDRERSDKSKRITDRLTCGYTYKINHFSTANFGYDHALRRDTLDGGNIRINELRLNISVQW